MYLQAAEAASAATTAFGLTDEAMPPLELPSFGESIAFNPRSHRGCKSGAREPAKYAADVTNGATGDHLNAEEAGSQDMEVSTQSCLGSVPEKLVKLPGLCTLCATTR